jgi:hypothetical protein
MSTFIQEARPLSEPLHQVQRDREGEGEGARGNRAGNPVDRLPDWRTTLPLAQAAPRCGAKTRSGAPCRQAAMRNARYRLHGGKSTGPRTPEGIERIRKVRTIHGRRSAKMIALRREMAQWVKLARETIQKVD